MMAENAMERLVASIIVSRTGQLNDVVPSQLEAYLIHSVDPNAALALEKAAQVPGHMYDGCLR